MTATEYLLAMQKACNGKIYNPNLPYNGIEGHQRLARECGYAVNDFNSKDQEEILERSYSMIYEANCKKTLLAKEE